MDNAKFILGEEISFMEMFILLRKILLSLEYLKRCKRYFSPSELATSFKTFYRYYYE